jgi:pimeloyl-ACP methyl ester carboxylesterase
MTDMGALTQTGQKQSEDIVSRLLKVAGILMISLFVFIGSGLSNNTANAADAEPLGIALEGYPYPYPVQYLPLVVGTHVARLAYMDVAPATPNGRAVVLLHGRNFPSSYWEPTIKALSGAGYRVVAFDQISFGKSSKLDDVPVDWDISTIHMLSLLDHLGLKRVDIIAHSMGNMLGVRFTRTHPDRVNHLVMYGPVGLEDYRYYVPYVAPDILLKEEMNRSAEAYYNYIVNVYGTTLSKEDIWKFVDIRERMKGSAEWPRWVASFVSSYYAMWGQPIVHELPLIITPTLMMVGTKERQATGKSYAPPELQGKMGHIVDLAKAIVPQMPNAQLEVFEGIGHLIHLEATERFNARVLKFLQS